MAVLCAGMSGLIAARELHRRGIGIVVLESAERPGGNHRGHVQGWTYGASSPKHKAPPHNPAAQRSCRRRTRGRRPGFIRVRRDESGIHEARRLRLFHAGSSEPFVGPAAPQLHRPRGCADRRARSLDHAVPRPLVQLVHPGELA
ncbi:hypothetical protein B0T44_22275 [Nocardia donostiensis]|uniref:Amine oxidase domain-containing protein n=1 Tax=Nocardia donostiensis TaxID=1538463 RepID=A0A1V2TKE2_9NOCA|nr:hypothetical protein B0T46_02485 [Nocardia donostiensis]OQS15656.1 hypothetical protein B0T36_06565 [Nocardia donostiensis]OQS17950.1 hypothetical protein B0T44_22275 [Nocardia donostiensis]